MTSQAFDRFRFSFVEDGDSARQGLDAAALAELVGDERSSAEAMLIDLLPDSRAIIGLGLLRSSRAEPQLTELFEVEQQAARLAPDGDRSPDALIHLGEALWRIRPDPRWLAPAIDVLGSADDAIQRKTAAEALAGVRDASAVRALIMALDDPDSLVRYHSARGLLAIHGLPLACFTDLDHMTFRVMSKDATRRDGGKQDVLSAVAGSSLQPGMDFGWS